MQNKWISFQIILAGLPFVISSMIRLGTMKACSLLVLDYSSISFSFALLSYILSLSISKAKNPIPNQRQNEEFKKKNETDKLYCFAFCSIFILLFGFLEFFQISVVTNLSNDFCCHYLVCIFINMLAFIVFVNFSNKINDNYKLKISL